MKLFFLILTVVALFVSASCSGTGASDNANAANQTAESAPGDFTDANAALAEGSRLLDDDETDRAIAVLNRAVELNPDLAEAYFKLGIAYALVESRDAAIVEAQITPTPLPGEKRPKEQKREKTNSEKAFEKAVEAYKKMLRADEADAAAHFNLGRAYNKLNEDEEAAKSLKQAVKLNPEDTEYQTELGAILIKLAEYREAIPPLKKALELDPENSRAQELLEDAEAGRRRIDFKTEKKDDKGKSNSNANANTAVPESNTKPPETKPVKTPSPAKKPE